MPGTKQGAKKRVSSFQIHEDEIPLSTRLDTVEKVNTIQQATAIIQQWQVEVRRTNERITLHDVLEGRGTEEAIQSFEESRRAIRSKLNNAKRLLGQIQHRLRALDSSGADADRVPASPSNEHERLVQSDGLKEVHCHAQVEVLQDQLTALEVHGLDSSDPSRAADRHNDAEAAIIKKAIHLIFGFDPRPIQTLILRWLLFDRKDCIVTGKTSMGKSLPIQAMPLLLPGTVAIAILPLDKIGVEQVEKCLRLCGGNAARPIHINGDSKSKDPRVFDKIKALEYTHIFLGPEQAVSLDFARVLTDVHFKRKVCLVAVDEAHLVGKWGRQFRQCYAQLSLVRTRLGRTNAVPWYACTATLDGAGYDALLKGASFDPDTRRIRSSIDRPEIAILFQPIPKRQIQSFSSLAFTVEKCCNDGRFEPLAMPRTVIFVESKSKTRLIALQLRKWMKRLCPSVTDNELKIAVSTYHRSTATIDKENTYQLAKDLDTALRIVVATESLGLGIDLPYIDAVVVYGLPIERDLDTIVQRIGRCVRVSTRPDGTLVMGTALVLYEHQWADDQKGATVESSAVDGLPNEIDRAEDPTEVIDGADEDDTIAAGLSTATFDTVLPSTEIGGRVDTTAKSAPQSNATKSIPNVLVDIIATSKSGCCIRRIILQYYEEWCTDTSTRMPPPDKDRCCSGCNPLLLPTFRPPGDDDRRQPLKGPVRRYVKERLLSFCKEQAKRVVPNVSFNVPVDVFLDPDLITDLANACLKIERIEDVRTVIGSASIASDTMAMMLEVMTKAKDEIKEKERLARAEKQDRLGRFLTTPPPGHLQHRLLSVQPLTPNLESVVSQRSASPSSLLSPFVSQVVESKENTAPRGRKQKSTSSLNNRPRQVRRVLDTLDINSSQ